MTPAAVQHIGGLIYNARALANVTDEEIRAALDYGRERRAAALGSRGDWDAELRQCLAAVADAHRRLAALAGVDVLGAGPEPSTS